MIFYDWFYPGFKAGGPIQSLANLSGALLKEGFEVFVITGNTDLNSRIAYEQVVSDAWNNIKIPGVESVLKVFYGSKKKLNRTILKKLVEEVKPSVMYLNGIFSYRFFILPLLITRRLSGEYKLVICPRGMLKEGALSSKALKKKVYLQFLRFSKQTSLAYWHATTKDEVSDIQTHFPVNKGVSVAFNIPKVPYSRYSIIHKKKGELKLVYLSLINKHKNLLQLLQVISKTTNSITLDIYGPVTDSQYWKSCVELISKMPGNVTYKGVVNPLKVQETISSYQLLILLTKGENFGHALYESLSVGRPVITSFFTPWNDLYEQNGGLNIDVSNISSCVSAIESFAALNQEDYNRFCSGAYHIATNYFQDLINVNKYKRLFSCTADP